MYLLEWADETILSVWVVLIRRGGVSFRLGVGGLELFPIRSTSRGPMVSGKIGMRFPVGDVRGIMEWRCVYRTKKAVKVRRQYLESVRQDLSGRLSFIRIWSPSDIMQNSRCVKTRRCMIARCFGCWWPFRVNDGSLEECWLTDFGYCFLVFLALLVFCMCISVSLFCGHSLCEDVCWSFLTLWDLRGWANRREFCILYFWPRGYLFPTGPSLILEQGFIRPTLVLGRSIIFYSVRRSI